MDFSNRSFQPELLDGEHIPFSNIKRNMEELAFINQYLGGHKITLKGIGILIEDFNTTRPCRILEIGCGGGDNLQAIQRWADRNGVNVELTGIDINGECINYARSRFGNARYIHSDYAIVDDTNADIIFSSLFCHHLNNEQLEQMFHWCRHRAATGFFINDLHRNRIAYHSIKLLTGIFSRSYLVKNDAPLSVLRGFKRKDWLPYLTKTTDWQYSIEWYWAFRWLLIAKKRSDAITQPVNPEAYEQIG